MRLYTKMNRFLLTSSRLRLLHCVNTNVKCLYSSGPAESKRVYLHDFHVSKKAKMTAFGGYLMPLQYSQSIIESHKHTREHVSIFDVSHMLQTVVTGRDRVRCIESLVVSDIEGLNTNQGTLTVFTNEKGGIIDDLIVTKTDRDSLYLVSNAGCRDKDLSLLQGACSSGAFEVSLSVLKDTVLLAVQGPGTAKVLQPLVGGCDLGALKFMTTVTTSICGIDQCRITRCGYTGEDGVEISMPASESVFILESLLASKEDAVQLAGLGARDTLRLEAGLCLYGNDITENTTPIEAGLAWTIGKRRRAEKGFPGAEIILKQLKEKPARKRVGFISDGPSPRGGTEILTPDGKVVGQITSGCRSPCLQRNVSMGYVEAPFSKVGTLVNFVLHKKTVEGHVTKMPFVPTRYFM